jgi:hypothetical protein
MRRGPGRPRNDGLQPGSREAAEASERGSNVSDATRLEYLERGRSAFLIMEEKRLALQSARGIYSQIIKDARKAGCSQIAWTIRAMRRDPLEIEHEFIERTQMLRVARIPLGVQLGLFPGHGETLEEMSDRIERGVEDVAQALEKTMERVGPESLAQTVEQAWAKEDAVKDVSRETLKLNWPTEEAPPRPGPDDPSEPDENGDEEVPEDEPPEEEEEPMEVAKAGNEILEDGMLNQAAFKQGERNRKLGRTLEANPYKDVSPQHNAWIRGWKAEDAASPRR